MAAVDPLVTISRTGKGATAVYSLRLINRDATLEGLPATLSVEARVQVCDESPVNKTSTLWQQDIIMPPCGLAFDVALPANGIPAYTYKGQKIAIHLQSTVSLKDPGHKKVRFSRVHQFPHMPKIDPPGDALDIFIPRHVVQPMVNLRALPWRSKAVFVLMVAPSALAMLLLALCIVAPEFMYQFKGLWALFGMDLSTMDMIDFQDITSVAVMPIMVILVLPSGFLIFQIWKKLLRSYLSGGFTPAVAGVITRGMAIPLGELIWGNAHIPLDHLRVRVVAGNLECGCCKRGSSYERTITFTEPVRAIVLFETELHDIPPGPLQGLLPAEPIKLDVLFDAFYPANMVTEQYGMELCLVVQFIHMPFADIVAMESLDCAIEDFRQRAP